MTSQSSTINERSVKRAGFMPLFGFSMKQFWTTMLLFGIILFFVIPVPVLMVISQRDLSDVNMLIRTRNMFANTWAVELRYALIPIMSVLGVVVACSRFKYLKNKVSIDFYHSLPVKRSRLYVSQLAISALAVVIPFVINILLAIAFIGANGLMSDVLIVNLLLTSGEAFVYALLIYAISVLIGMISGLTAVQLTLTAVGLVILPATLLLTLGFVQIFNENMWFDFYAREENFMHLSPVLRFLLNTKPLSMAESAIMLVLSAIFLILAYVIYTKRKSERAGTPVVFTPLGEVIKYVLMFSGTLLGGILYYYIMNEDFIWTIFGMACGMVLVFMLTNTILQKTAKAMFRGWKGLCVFAAVTVVCMTVFMTNMFGINSYVPAPDNTSKVEISFDYGSSNFEFTDPECIDAVYRLYTESEWAYSERVRNGIWWQYETQQISVVFYPKAGILIAKNVHIYNKSDFIEEFRTLLDSKEFKAQYVSDVYDISGDGYVNMSFPSYRINPADGTLWRHNINPGWWFDKLDLNYSRAREMKVAEILDAAKSVGFDHFQQQNYGQLNITGYGGRYNSFTYPIYASMTEITKYFVKNGVLSMTPDDTIEQLSAIIDGITVYYAPEGAVEAEKHTFTDKEEINALLEASTNIFGGANMDVFTFVDTDFEGFYSVEVQYGDYSIYNREDGYVVWNGEQEVYVEDYTEAVEIYDTQIEGKSVEKNQREFELSFLLGKVPDFVYKAFGVEK